MWAAHRMWQLSLFFQWPTFFDCFCESPMLQSSRSPSRGFVSATVSATLQWESSISVRHTIPSRQTKFHNKGEETAFAVNHLLIRKWLCQKKKKNCWHAPQACACGGMWHGLEDYTPELDHRVWDYSMSPRRRRLSQCLECDERFSCKRSFCRTLAALDVKLFLVLCHRRRHSKWPNNDVF